MAIAKDALKLRKSQRKYVLSHRLEFRLSFRWSFNEWKPRFSAIEVSNIPLLMRCAWAVDNVHRIIFYWKIILIVLKQFITDCGIIVTAWSRSRIHPLFSVRLCTCVFCWFVCSLHSPWLLGRCVTFLMSVSYSSLNFTLADIATIWFVFVVIVLVDDNLCRWTNQRQRENENVAEMHFRTNGEKKWTSEKS